MNKYEASDKFQPLYIATRCGERLYTAVKINQRSNMTGAMKKELSSL